MRLTIPMLAGLAAVLALPTAADAATVGATKVYARHAAGTSGVTHAYRGKSRSSGRVDRLNVYLDARSTASRVQLGLYAGNASKPGVRRAKCVIARPAAGAWNQCPIRATRVVAGRTYWLALLKPSHASGRLRYRVRIAASRAAYSAHRALPGRWRAGGSRRAAHTASIYASTAADSSPFPSGPGSGPVTGAPPAPAPTGFPDESSTGVPPGTALTNTGPLTISQAGAVVDGVDAPSVVVDAPNVTIRNSRIHGGETWLVRNKSTGLVIEDSEIDGEGANNTGVGSSDFTLRRVSIRGAENGIDVGGGNVTVENSYIHDLTTANGAHTDGAQIGEGAHDLVFRHNTIRPNPDAVWRSTSAIIMWDEGGAQNTRVWIENNLLDGTGASAAVYSPREAAQAIYINGNRMRKGASGYTIGVRVGTTVTEFNGNVDADSGAAIRASG
jgi:hypothetical protein